MVCSQRQKRTKKIRELQEVLEESFGALGEDWTTVSRLSISEASKRMAREVCARPLPNLLYERMRTLDEIEDYISQVREIVFLEIASFSGATVEIIRSLCLNERGKLNGWEEDIFRTGERILFESWKSDPTKLSLEQLPEFLGKVRAPFLRDVATESDRGINRLPFEALTIQHWISRQQKNLLSESLPAISFLFPLSEASPAETVALRIMATRDQVQQEEIFRSARDEFFGGFYPDPELFPLERLPEFRKQVGGIIAIVRDNLINEPEEAQVVSE